LQSGGLSSRIARFTITSREVFSQTTLAKAYYCIGVVAIPLNLPAYSAVLGSQVTQIIRGEQILWFCGDINIGIREA